MGSVHKSFRIAIDSVIFIRQSVKLVFFKLNLKSVFFSAFWIQIPLTFLWTVARVSIPKLSGVLSNEPHKYCQVRNLVIPESGLRTHLKEFGFVKLFRKDFKKEDSRHYILYLPNEEKIKDITRNEFMTIHDTHWGIETFHRAIKQVCGICRFMVRDTHAIKTHIFCSLQAFVRLEFMRVEKIISNWYEVQRNLFTLVVREHIFANLNSNNMLMYT